MKYYVIYDEVEGTYEDQTHKFITMECDTKDAVVEIVVKHPEAIVIYGKRYKIDIIPMTAKITSQEK